MSQSLDLWDGGTLSYIITHVFCPLQLPGRNDHSIYNDRSLAKAFATAAGLYNDHIKPDNVAQWNSISRMLENLSVTIQSERMDRLQTTSQFHGMGVGDVLAFLIRAQNAGVIFRKQKDVTIFEAFEVSPKAESVMAAKGKLICSYPGPAIEIPNSVFNDVDFLRELANFLVHMNEDDLEVTSGKEPKFRDTAHPRYITELLTGILRGVGHPADIPRISKRVGDDVCCDDASGLRPWRRSSLWLLLRVSIQTTLDRSLLGHHIYKEFMLFFMCCLAEEKASEGLPSDILHFMSAKISRRLRKLGSSAPDWLSRTVLETCTSLRSTIEDRWTQVQAAQSASPPWNPSELNLAQDIHLSLSHSRDYLLDALTNRSVSPPSVPFNPTHPPRGTLDDFLSSGGAFFEDAHRIAPYVTLYDVERAVEQGIDAWTSHVTNNDKACEQLEILVDKYSSCALKTYANNPELLSVLQLTTIELWVALDKIAIKEVPILADYSPEIPTRILENLLLCKTGSLDRLRSAYEYISHRHSRSRARWSVFASKATADSFAVRVCKSSSRLRQLKTQIEKEARREHREKIIELQEKNACHANFQKLGLLDYTIDTIAIHQWPLPVNQLEAEALVFELECPVAFDMWRSATLHLMIDLYSTPTQQTQSLPSQSNCYQPLQPYLVKHPRSRAALHFDTCFLRRGLLYIPAKREQVCAENALKFSILETHTGIPLSEVMRPVDNSGFCTYKLTTGRYQCLQNYVNSTSHTSNEVIANQAERPKDISIYEYMAYGHLRSGGLLQWFNILRELRSRSLNFRSPDVHMLLAQAVSQIGPLRGRAWMWHEEVRHPTFCNALLREIRCFIQDVEASWLERTTMDTISFLLRRLLSSSPNDLITLEILSLLRMVRVKVFTWILELSAALTRTPRDHEIRDMLRDTAAVCRSTFDVNPATIFPKILHSAEDIDILLTSAIIIHHHMPADASRLPVYSQLLLDRDRRLSLVLEQVVSDTIQTNSGSRGMKLVIDRLLLDYHPGSKWIPLPVPNSRWFSCTTAPSANQSPQVIYLNILDGSFLINGKPIGTGLPREYVQHPLYKLLFGERILEVTPGGLPGMEYSTRELIFDHRVSFSLVGDGSTLVIQAQRRQRGANESEILEFVTRDKLEGDLPTRLINGHAHWLNLSTSVMEIRPLDRLWDTSAENWQIDCTPEHCRMWKGHEYLVDIRSQTWDMVSSLLNPLSSHEDLIISVSPVKASQPTSTLQLSVVLPYYDLSFYVDEDGDLQSHDIRSMVYDKNQSIGTLFGLATCLVLRPKFRHVYGINFVPRCVLIPDGKVSFRVNGHHVHVGITPGRSRHGRVTYQTYRVNADLGCLAGNGSLTSRLYCAYLHSLTSGCCADPLTGRSGTEESLSILRSGGCWSTTRFSPRDAVLLSLIASVCPSRTWYREQTIQRVVWCDLPANSQNHELYIVSKAIKEHYEEVQQFHETQAISIFQEFPSQDNHLLKRSAGRRVAQLLAFETSREPSGANLDVSYSARDLVKFSSGEHRACAATTDVCHRAAIATKDICGLVQSWKTVNRDATLSLQYDKSWLVPDLPLIWLKVYNLLREDNEKKWHQLLFSLPAMAYASPARSDLVRVFIAFASCQQFRLEDPPNYDTYHISEGWSPSLTTLEEYISRCSRPFTSPTEDSKTSVAQRLLNAWPSETPPPCSLNDQFYDKKSFRLTFQYYFSCWFHNLKLVEHLTRVQEILDKQCSHASPIPDIHRYLFHPAQSIPNIHPPFRLSQLFTRPAPLLSMHESLLQCTPALGGASPTDLAPLNELIAMAGTEAANPFQVQYVSALRASAEYFEKENSHVADGSETKLPAAKVLMDHYTRCSTSYIEGLHHLQRHLGPGNQGEQAVWQSGQWPCITVYALFRCLASNSAISLPDDWRRCIINLALLALALQRARRLFLLSLDGFHEEFFRELENEGCESWNADWHPDWLLIQLQSDLLVRRVQAEIAHEMIKPRSGENTTMQLNMGEGKTSVIVPIVAAVLADGNQLVRVVVPKPLIAQTLHLLTDRLGGLVSRRIYFLPISRSLQINQEKATSMHKILLRCMQEHGILVLQPEHVLSLKLSCMEKQLSQGHLADVLMKAQKWLHSHSRDILDESDEILDIRSQLVFTIGHQQHMEDSPNRWTSTQQILSVVNKHASSLRELFPYGVAYDAGPPGSFPQFRILRAEAGQELISRVAQDVLQHLLLNFSLGQLNSDLRNAIQRFVSCKDIPLEVVRPVKEFFQKTPLWDNLLLLRGLLGGGILLFAFKDQRWRVEYGLSPNRTRLAVPYRAKDVPSERAEYGHPDVAIILTCLSYYYGGLTEAQLKDSFEILLGEFDPSVEYSLWVGVCPTVPESLRSFRSINIKSAEQWNRFLFPLFSRNRLTVDFYLARVVFPEGAKQFPSKLSSSGWDLAEKKERLLTGFSGTNDGQYLLPLHISQSDSDRQRGTNARVLSYLLRPENNHYICIANENDERLTTHEFLRVLVAQKPAIRVILDVGAQMLDLRTHELAQAWLVMNPDASAAIYFNEEDELTVCTRDGDTQLLRSSPFLQQLDLCVIYLDDIHTRGIDIKFPSGFRAAVTLGPRVTKDRLVQGCMRMRMLGHGHSIMFFAPIEVDRRIRSVAGKDFSRTIDTMDILHWAIRETWENIHRWAPHWIQQGTEHASRYDAWSNFSSGQLTSKELLDNWVQPEAKSMEELYLPRDSSSVATLDNLDFRKRCLDLGIQSLCFGGLDEEQERELVYEAHLEPETERPLKAQPAIHSIHPDVVNFVKTGIVSTSFESRNHMFIPAFDTLHATSAVTNEPYIWSQSVLVSADFKETVKTSEKMDSYLRPVYWVVSASRTHGDLLVVLSPHEVNHLLPDIRSSNKVHLHLYTPRLVKSMKPCDDLSLYSIPAIPDTWNPPCAFMDQLCVFAGQLYFKDYRSYIRLCRFLCVFTRDLGGKEGVRVGPEGFISPVNRAKLQLAHTFESTPIVFLRALMSLRNKEIDFAPTHIGKLTRGELLSEGDFEA